MWGVVVPGPWLLAAAAIACGGFFMSLVNAPMQAFVMLRIPRDLRTQALAFSAVLNCVAAPRAAARGLGAEPVLDADGDRRQCWPFSRTTC